MNSTGAETVFGGSLNAAGTCDDGGDRITVTNSGAASDLVYGGNNNNGHTGTNGADTITINGSFRVKVMAATSTGRDRPGVTTRATRSRTTTPRAAPTSTAGTTTPS